ncbi:hypothetical protein AVEN_44032-1 [Araneus ventricosus]|uniref:Uncharacterized protein n=1 Tax=Araneus ventricosus TaxID=182803 RepID=A0A4Y2HAF0_ARAVE|nr:hypothetical protein AVEN_44032-1 [Araneus ventricosus]
MPNSPSVRTFIPNWPSIWKCYSDNLHLYQNALKPDIKEIDFNYSTGSLIMRFKLNLYEIKLFYASDRPQVFVGIHSPYVPDNPMIGGQAIYPGNRYEFIVELDKEEHRLPPPYQTSCRDNGPSEDAIPFTNPNSYEMCLEMCRSEFFNELFSCKGALTMFSAASDMCNFNFDGGKLNKISKPLSAIRRRRHSCIQNCKPECLKLHYKYKMSVRGANTALGDPADFDEITIFVKNTEVTVLRHVPLYGSGETFSYIGGLVGFWLGVSVFTFTDTIEKLYRKAVNWKMSFKMNNVQSAPTSVIHLD